MVPDFRSRINSATHQLCGLGQATSPDLKVTPSTVILCLSQFILNSLKGNVDLRIVWIGLYKWPQSYTFPCIHVLCNVTLQLLSWKSGSDLQPWIWAGLVTCFGQRDMVELTVCFDQVQPSKGLCASLLSLGMLARLLEGEEAEASPP